MNLQINEFVIVNYFAKVNQIEKFLIAFKRAEYFSSKVYKSL